MERAVQARPDPAPDRRQALVGYGLLVVTALCWSGAWITARLAAHDAPALTVTVGRYVVAAAGLAPAWWFIDRRKRFRPTGREWGVLVGMALTGVIAYTVLFLVGMQFAPASDGAVVVPGLAGLFAMVVALLFVGTRPGGRALAGALVALGGTVLVGWSALRQAGLDSDRFTGDLVLVAAAATWGTYTVLGKQISGRVPAITGILLASVLGSVILAPVALVVDGVPELTAWSWRAHLNVGYLGLVATSIAFVTFYLGVQAVGIDRTAPFLGLIPLFAVAEAAILLDETITPLHAAGGVLVVIGIALPALRRRHHRRGPATTHGQDGTGGDDGDGDGEDGTDEGTSPRIHVTATRPR